MSYEGIVKFFKKDGGFGFIWPKSDMDKLEAERDQIFFHASKVVQSDSGFPIFLNRDDHVTFDLSESSNGGQEGVNIVRTKNVRDMRRTNLVATNVTIGLQKSDIPVWLEILTQMSEKQNSDALTSEENAAVSRFYKTIKSIDERFSLTPKATVTAAIPTPPPVVVEQAPKKGNGGKNTHKNTQQSA